MSVYVSTLRALNLLPFLIFLNFSCSGQQLSQEIKVIPGESLGGHSLNEQKKSSIEEDEIYIFADASNEIFYIYTQNEECVIFGKKIIGEKVEMIESLLDEKRTYDENSSKMFFGEDVFIFDGVFITVKDEIISGIGIRKRDQ